jgi:hypothetical protein
MNRLLLITILFVCLAGCATSKGKLTPPPSNRNQASGDLSAALHELERGRQEAAIALLEKVVAEPGVRGVTDEALFRLSVLNLSQDEKLRVSTSIRYLERLEKEYGDSKWTQQGKPLLLLLNDFVQVEKRNHDLKQLNISLSKQNAALSKENKELHQSINRLKDFDLKMERERRPH